MDVDQHILKALRGRPAQSRPMTIGDLARQLGVTRMIVAPAAQRLVDEGLAQPSMIAVRGVPTLHGLLPLAAADPVVAVDPVTTD